VVTVAPKGLVDAVEPPQEELLVARAHEVLLQRVLDDRALGEAAGGAVVGQTVSEGNGETGRDPHASDFGNGHGEDSAGASPAACRAAC